MLRLAAFIVFGLLAIFYASKGVAADNRVDSAVFLLMAVQRPSAWRRVIDLENDFRWTAADRRTAAVTADGGCGGHFSEIGYDVI